MRTENMAYKSKIAKVCTVIALAVVHDANTDEAVDASDVVFAVALFLDR